MLAFLLLTSTISSTSSLECHNYLDSPLIPSVLDANNTCTGSYCYRIESKIVHDSFDPNQHAVLMGCFEYPLPTLTLGCRRNFEESVLCVCQSADFCNGAPSTDVRDLPIIRDCRHQYGWEDGKPDDRRTCASHYCMSYRQANSPAGGEGLVPTTTFGCQDKEGTPALERFDVFVGGVGTGVIPAGACMKFQDEYFGDLLLSKHCTTPSKWPGASGLPEDMRTEGMIDCATPSTFGGMRSCRGHQCYMMKQTNFDPVFGCIVYDERNMDKKFMLGTQQPLPGQAFYICETDNCNANTDPKRAFSGFKVRIVDDVNETCNCLAPKGNDVATVVEVGEAGIDVTLILSIAIPAFLMFLIAVVVGYRVFKNQWPLAFLCGKANGRVGQKRVVINVVSAGPLEKKTKLY